jgi:hypothetical protein
MCEVNEKIGSWKIFHLENAWKEKAKLEMIAAPRGLGCWAAPNLSFLA